MRDFTGPCRSQVPPGPVNLSITACLPSSGQKPHHGPGGYSGPTRAHLAPGDARLGSTRAHLALSGAHLRSGGDHAGLHRTHQISGAARACKPKHYGMLTQLRAKTSPWPWGLLGAHPGPLETPLFGSYQIKYFVPKKYFPEPSFGSFPLVL